MAKIIIHHGCCEKKPYDKKLIVSQKRLATKLIGAKCHGAQPEAGGGCRGYFSYHPPISPQDIFKMWMLNGALWWDLVHKSELFMSILCLPLKNIEFKMCNPGGGVVL